MPKTKTSPLSEDQFFQDDSSLIEADRHRVQAKTEGENLIEGSRVIGRKIIDTLKVRGTKTLVSHGWRITLVQPESVVVDYTALLQLLNPRQRRRIMKRSLTLDVANLPPAKIKAIKAALGPAKYRSCLSETVDRDAVSQAVQEGMIDADVVASVSEVVPGTAYLRSGASDA